MSAAAIPVSIRRVEGSNVSRVEDMLAVEEPLEIRLGSRSLSITMRTPGDDIELATGFLFSEGFIRDISEVGSVSQPGANVVTFELKNEQRQARARARRTFLMTSACGVCGKASLRDLKLNSCPAISRDEIRLDPAMICALPHRLRQAQSAFDATGGLHAASRFSLCGELESVREDVGRHNALDKLVGAALLNNSTPLSNSVLLVSGRASFELVQKALMAGFPVLAAVGAPSSLAATTAKRSGMTLIGFLRNGRFNVYAGSNRVRGLELLI